MYCGVVMLYSRHIVLEHCIIVMKVFFNFFIIIIVLPVNVVCWRSVGMVLSSLGVMEKGKCTSNVVDILRILDMFQSCTLPYHMSVQLKDWTRMLVRRSVCMIIDELMS